MKEKIKRILPKLGVGIPKLVTPTVFTLVGAGVGFLFDKRVENTIIKDIEAKERVKIKEIESKERIEILDIERNKEIEIKKLESRHEAYDEDSGINKYEDIGGDITYLELEVSQWERIKELAIKIIESFSSKYRPEGSSDDDDSWWKLIENLVKEYYIQIKKIIIKILNLITRGDNESEWREWLENIITDIYKVKDGLIDGILNRDLDGYTNLELTHWIILFRLIMVTLCLYGIIAEAIRIESMLRMEKVINNEQLKDKDTNIIRKSIKKIWNNRILIRIRNINLIVKEYIFIIYSVALLYNLIWIYIELINLVLNRY